MLFLRFKAFIIDMFMIMMPIMYVMTYVIFGSKEQYASSLSAPWISMCLYAVIIILFWYFKHQTPGMKAYNLVLLKNSDTPNHISNINKKEKINETTTINKQPKQQYARVSFLYCVYRYLLFIATFVFFALLLVSFFRKDKKTIYDLLSQTYIAQEQVS